TTRFRSGGSKSEYASGLFALYLPPDDGPTPVEPTATVEAGDLKSLAGAYFDEKDGRLLQIMVNKAGILGIAGGGPLVPVAEKQFRLKGQSLFFMSEAEVEIRFLSEGRFELKTADGEVRHFQRAKPWSPSADDI